MYFDTLITNGPNELKFGKLVQNKTGSIFNADTKTKIYIWWHLDSVALNPVRGFMFVIWYTKLQPGV